MTTTITSLAFNSYFITNLIKELNKNSIVSITNYSQRLKFYPITQLILILPIIILKTLINFTDGEVNFPLALTLTILTNLRSIIFCIVFGLTKGVKTRVKNIFNSRKSKHSINSNRTQDLDNSIINDSYERSHSDIELNERMFHASRGSV